MRGGIRRKYRPSDTAEIIQRHLVEIQITAQGDQILFNLSLSLIQKSPQDAQKAIFNP